MAGSIADFKASFRTDLARSNKFDVYVPVPLGMIPFLGTSRNLALRCENAQLPGRNIETTPMRIYGVNELFPVSTSYENITLTFLVGDDMKEKIFFDAWLNWIQPTLSYDTKYKSDYAVLLRVNQYDVQNKLSLSIDMIDAFPVAVNQLDLDWSSDSIHKLAVTFAYTSWRSNDLSSIAMEYLENKIGDLLTNSKLGNDITNLLDTGSLDVFPANNYAGEQIFEGGGNQAAPG